LNKARNSNWKKARAGRVMSGLIVRACYKDKELDIDFEVEEGFETLIVQVSSLFERDDLVLLDSQGRRVASTCDIEDVKVKEENEAKEVWVAKVFCCEEAHNTLAQCSGLLCGSGECVLQPSHVIEHTELRLCSSCQLCLDPSLVVTERRMLRAFCCDGQKARESGLLPAYSSPSSSAMSEPESMYVRRTLLEQAVQAQDPREGLSAAASMSEAERDMASRIAGGKQNVRHYEQPSEQQAARAAIDYAKVHANAMEYLQSNEGAQEDVAFLSGLMRWFKQDFFKWTNRPPCQYPDCAAKPPSMTPKGTVAPSAEEREVGLAGRTELYECSECKRITRFPRYNRPSQLLKSRNGRCGEFANCFCLILRALAFDARWVLDFTDHVWVEVYVESLGRSVHMDCCERAFDAPLMYELGWRKKLTYVLSFSRYGMVDATPRYSRSQVDVLTRRNATGEVSEKFLRQCLEKGDNEMEQEFMQSKAGKEGEAPPRTHSIDMLLQGAVVFEQLASTDISITTMKRRKRLMAKELLGMTLARANVDASKLEEKQGRISGDENWKRSRGELGEQLQGQGRFPSVHQVEERAWLVPNMLLVAPGSPSMTISVLSTCILDDPRLFQENLMPIMVDNISIAQNASGNNVAAISSRGSLIYSTCADTKCEREEEAAAVEDVDDSSSSSSCAVLPPPPPPPKVRDTTTPAIIVSCLLDQVQGKDCNQGLQALGVTALSSFDSSFMQEGSKSSWVSINARSEVPLFEPLMHMQLEHNGPCLLKVSMMRALEDIHTPVAACMSVIDNFVCSMPYRLLFKQEGESAEDFTIRAQGECLKDQKAMGFSRNIDSSVAFFFDRNGHPLVAKQGVKTHIKLVAEEAMIDLPLSPLPLPSILYRYIPLGGGCHADTIAFDSSLFLQPIIDCLAHDEPFDALWSSLRVTQVSLYAGETIVNGVQFRFGVGGAAGYNTFASPCFTSFHDSPIEKALVLQEDDEIKSITVRSGALVDSISLRTKKGIEFKSGGEGGDSEHTLEIGPDEKLVGFFGGMGGHCHHVGAVVASHHASPRGAVPRSIEPRGLASKLIRIADELELWSICLLNNTQNIVEQRNSAFVGTLVELTVQVLLSNSLEMSRSCLEAIAAYSKNLAKAPNDPKKKLVKMHNAFFLKNIHAARGGVALFQFGPSSFVFSFDGNAFQCSQRLVADRGDLGREEWITSLERFSDFLLTALSLA